MMFKNRTSLFVATFLIIGFFFLALPEKGVAGIGPLGCCFDSQQTPAICQGCGELGSCSVTLDRCTAELGQFWSTDLVCMGDGSCVVPPTGGAGCCLFSEGDCEDDLEWQECNGNGEAWFLSADCSEVSECPQFITNINSPIPTLSEWGLIAMAGVLGIVGFMVIRRRKVTA